jgi:glyoxylase-like metal-dependent hydrolase (beta-lactamase superfamily II)
MQSTARRCLHGLRHLLEPVDRETEIVPGVRLVPAPGHSPGHLAVLIASGGELLLNLGDAAVHPFHLEEPEWENGFDLEGGRAAETRRMLSARAAEEKMRVMAFHFPFPSVGRLEPGEQGGWSWKVGE